MKIQDYLSKIENEIIFYPISDETWQAIQEEGLLEEMNALTRRSWWEGEMKLSLEDKAGLSAFNPEIVEKFNQFDIALKDTYNLKMIDLIDYEAGKVIIVKTRV